MERIVREWIPKYHTLEWKGKSSSPLVYRSQTPDVPLLTVHEAWVTAIKQTTGLEEHRLKKYTRFNAVINYETVAITIYNNNTVMFQGDESLAWASTKMEQISKEIDNIILDSNSNSTLTPIQPTANQRSKRREKTPAPTYLRST